MMAIECVFEITHQAYASSDQSSPICPRRRAWTAATGSIVARQLATSVSKPEWLVMGGF